MPGLGYATSLYYPSDLLAEYKNLTVDAAGHGVPVAVNRYRCRRTDYGGTVDAEEIKDGFLGVSRRAILGESGGATTYVGVFTGKGSPEEIANVLSLVYRYRQAFARSHSRAGGVLGACAQLIEENEGKPETLMQAFCDRYLGLDCNGFVGNYVRRVNPRLPGPSSNIQSFFDARRRLRTRAEDIELFDILIWPSSVHIAIVDEVGAGASSKAVIAQSTAGGPQLGTHSFVPAGTNRFRLAPTSRVAGAVQVVSLGLNVQG